MRCSSRTLTVAFVTKKVFENQGPNHVFVFYLQLLIFGEPCQTNLAKEKSRNDLAKKKARPRKVSPRTESGQGKIRPRGAALATEGKMPTRFPRVDSYSFIKNLIDSYRFFMFAHLKVMGWNF